MLSGEAGIGKSRITHTLRERLAGAVGGDGAAAVLALLQQQRALSGGPATSSASAGMTPTDSDAERTAKLAKLTGWELDSRPPRSATCCG